MQWYLAKLVYQILCGDGEHKPQFDEQLRLISATDSLHAFFRAQQVGEKEQDHFLNQQMLPVQWKFIEVCELHVLSELSDGAELYSRIAEADDAVNHIRELRTRASDLLNRALQETIETN